MGIYALRVLPLPMKDEDCIAYAMKTIEIEGVLRGIMQIKYYGIDYICDMDTFLGAISKSKGSSKAQMVKSLKTIISELQKLENTGDFKGVYVDSSYFFFLQTNMESALKRVEKYH